MLDATDGYLREIEQALKQIRMLGTLSYQASQSSSCSGPPPDWGGNGLMIVSLAEQGLDAWTDLFDQLAGDHGQKAKNL